MSKTKKTIKELLEEALVPDEEQPYEVPENWVWTKIGHVFKQAKEQVQPTGNEIYVGLEHIAKGGGILEVGNSEEVKSKKVIFNKYDVLYGKLRPYLNKHAYVEFEGVASTDILVLRNKNKITNKLLDMYLGLPHVIQYANENSNGINLPRVSPLAMDNMAFPLPPLNEQKRIADKVERLLNKIEEAKELIEEAKETFELRRAAILDKAFRGELTQKWRGENQYLNGLSEKQKRELEDSWDMPFELPEGWRWVRLSDVTIKITDGEHITPPLSDNGIPLLSAKDITTDDTLDFSDTKYVSEEVAEKSRIRCNPGLGDVVIVSRGAGVGRSTLVKTDEIFCLMGSVLLIKSNKDFLNSAFLDICIKSPYGHKVLNSASGSSAQQAIYIRDIKNFLIPLPPLEEQRKIVSILENYLTKDKLVNKILLIDEKINTLKQSILSKAFRGVLGTNDSSEESAIELLKEVLHEQVK